MNQELQQQVTTRLASDIRHRTEFAAVGLPLDADANYGVVARTLGTTPEQVAAAVEQHDGDAEAVVAAIIANQ